MLAPIIVLVDLAFVNVGLVVEGKRNGIYVYATFTEHSAAMNRTAESIATNLPDTFVGPHYEFIIQKILLTHVIKSICWHKTVNLNV